MKTSFTRCSECIVYHNWHSIGDWKKSFVKIVTGDFVDVPRKLANNIRGQISHEVMLEVPNGEKHSVQVSKEENGLVFQSGWAAFVSTYELEQGDTLLFEFSGSSCFEVRIFNRTGCEKELSCVAMNSTPCVHEMNMSLGNDTQSSTKTERWVNMRSKCHAICKDCAAFHYWHRMDKMRFFMVMMGVSDSKNGLTIPKGFANNIREQISANIELELPDGQKFGIQVAEEHHELILRSGWDRFSSAYELEEGDIVLFGYSGNSIFKVRIFDISGCDKLLSCVTKNFTTCAQQKSGCHDNPTQSPRESRTRPNDRRNRACTICIECVARHYWHMEDHTWSFFKVMILSNFKDEMAIPEEFATNFRGYISDDIKLEVPNGEIYNVQVAREQEKLVLQSGWRNFTGAYELEQGDFLVFIYSGDSHFKVQIFKPSCCEKELACVSCCPNIQERDICHDNPLQSHRERTERDDNRMKKPCVVCIECVGHHYWHMKAHDWSFFKIMSLGNFKDEMTIPPKFATNFRGHISDELKLEVPDGKIYNVQVAREQHKLVLGSGWANFASVYELKQNDFLVFTYSGDSHFKVKIFNPSGCENELSCVTMSCDPNVQERDIFHDQSLPTKKEGRNDGPSESWRTSKINQADLSSQKSSSVLNTEDVTFPKDIQEPRSSGGIRGSTESHYILEMGCKLTSAQKARVDAFLKENRTGIQFYVTTMNEKNLSDGFLVIRKEYAANHLPHQDQIIKLCHPQNSKTWDADLKVITDGACILSCIIFSGWPCFVRDNKLQNGDICAFEMSKSDGGVTIIVHPLKPASRQKMKVTRTDTGYVVTRSTELTWQQKRKIEERLHVIQPETKIFVSIMPSCRAKLYIEQGYADDHLPREEQWMRLQVPGKNHTWEAKLYIGDKENGKFYELHTGWKKFVNDNKLQDDDMCLFELLKNEQELTMNVHIIRRDHPVYIDVDE